MLAPAHMKVEVEGWAGRRICACAEAIEKKQETKTVHAGAASVKLEPAITAHTEAGPGLATVA